MELKNIDLSNTSQSYMFFEDFKECSAKKIYDFSEKHTNISRFLGLPIGICYSLLDLAQAVSNIGESLIKGIANIFGYPFSNNSSPLKGVKQIFIEIPLKLFNAAVFLPLGMGYDVLVRPILTSISPSGTIDATKEIAFQNKNFIDAIVNNEKLEGNFVAKFVQLMNQAMFI